MSQPLCRCCSHHRRARHVEPLIEEILGWQFYFIFLICKQHKLIQLDGWIVLLACVMCAFYQFIIGNGNAAYWMMFPRNLFVMTAYGRGIRSTPGKSPKDTSSLLFINYVARLGITFTLNHTVHFFTKKWLTNVYKAVHSTHGFHSSKPMIDWQWVMHASVEHAYEYRTLNKVNCTHSNGAFHRRASAVVHRCRR